MVNLIVQTVSISFLKYRSKICIFKNLYFQLVTDHLDVLMTKETLALGARAKETLEMGVKYNQVCDNAYTYYYFSCIHKINPVN